VLHKTNWKCWLSFHCPFYVVVHQSANFAHCKILLFKGCKKISIHLDDLLINIVDCLPFCETPKCGFGFFRVFCSKCIQCQITKLTQNAQAHTESLLLVGYKIYSRNLGKSESLTFYNPIKISVHCSTTENYAAFT
jgi:hypothetical protein